MNIIKSNKFIYYSIVILISFTLSVILEWGVSMPSDAIVFRNHWISVDDKTGVKNVLENTFSKKIKNREPGGRLITLSTTIELDKDMDNLSLVIIQQPNNGFRLTLDGIFLGQVGDLEKGWGNIWKDSGIFPVPFKLLKGEHTLKIEMFEFNQIELLNSPYLVNVKNHGFKYFYIKFINRFLGSFMVGISFVLGYLLIMLSIRLKSETRNQLILGIAFICWSIYFWDFQSIEFTVISYITYKKILVSLFVIGFIFNVYVVLKELSSDFGFKTKIIFASYLLIANLLIFVPKDVALFRLTSNIANLMCIILLLPLMLHPKILLCKDRSFNYIITGLVAASYFAFRYIYYEFAHKPHTQFAHIGLLVYLFFIFLYFLDDYRNRIDRMLHERQRADHYFNESVIDTLTGINNRKILDYINFEESIYTIIICDLDNFKAINDNYGHHTGDIVLKKLSEIIKESIRETDYVIRLGGDEFVILLRNCPEVFTKLKADEIWDRVNSCSIDSGEGKIGFGCSGGIAILEENEEFYSGLKRADCNLYKVKNGKKGEYQL